MTSAYKCVNCGHEQEHPSMLRSNPTCAKCGSLGMKRLDKKG